VKVLCFFFGVLVVSISLIYFLVGFWGIPKAAPDFALKSP
jgi:hypothetical protein